MGPPPLHGHATAPSFSCFCGVASRPRVATLCSYTNHKHCFRTHRCRNADCCRTNLSCALSQRPSINISRSTLSIDICRSSPVPTILSLHRSRLPRLTEPRNFFRSLLRSRVRGAEKTYHAQFDSQRNFATRVARRPYGTGTSRRNRFATF